MVYPYKIEGSQAKPVIIVGGAAGGDPVEVTIADEPIQVSTGGTPLDVTSDINDPVYIKDTWAFGTVYAITANQSQVIIVPAGKIWQILSIYVDLVTTATVGDRLLEVLLRDNLGNNVGMIRAGVVQAASLTRRYMLAPGLADLTAFRDTSFLTTPIPPTWIIPAAFSLLIQDNNAIDAAADDFTVRVMYAEKSA